MGGVDQLSDVTEDMKLVSSAGCSDSKVTVNNKSLISIQGAAVANCAGTFGVKVGSYSYIACSCKAECLVCSCVAKGNRL